MNPYVPTLRHQLLAEAFGTAVLLWIIVGSGIVVSRDGATGIGPLFAHAVTVGVGLGVLIHLLRPISGAQFNPAVTLFAFASRLITARQALAYVGAQTVGAVSGAVGADRLMRTEHFAFATTTRGGADQFVSEIAATGLLLIVIFLLVRDGRLASLPAAVGGYILAAILFTPSTAFANPAVTVARIFTDSYTGITAGSAVGFVFAQFAAIPLAFGLLALIRPNVTPAPTSHKD